jgi:hypothetical protein
VTTGFPVALLNSFRMFMSFNLLIGRGAGAVNLFFACHAP